MATTTRTLEADRLGTAEPSPIIITWRRFRRHRLGLVGLIILTVMGVLCFGASLWVIVIVLSVLGWQGISRLVRGQILSLRELEFVEATRALGASHSRIIFRHMLPNALAPIIVSATLAVGNFIITESALSFLG